MTPLALSVSFCTSMLVRSIEAKLITEIVKCLGDTAQAPRPWLFEGAQHGAAPPYHCCLTRHIHYVQR